MATTVGKLAIELGIESTAVLEACHRLGVSTFGEQTPLDEREASQIRSVLGAPGAAPSGVPAPPGYPGALPPPPRTKRDTPIWAALAVGALVAVTAVVGVGVFTGDDGDPASASRAGTAAQDDDEPTPTTAPTTTAVPTSNDLDVGDCWTDPLVHDQTVGGDEVGDLDVVACDQPHQAEVFFLDVFVDPPGTPYLGDERLVADATARCDRQWEAYVGIPISDSVFNITVAYPNERGWLMGDREIVCSLYPLDGTLLTTGARGSRR